MLIIAVVKLFVIHGLLVVPLKIGMRLDHFYFENSICLSRYSFTCRQFEEVYRGLHSPHGLIHLSLLNDVDGSGWSIHGAEKTAIPKA